VGERDPLAATSADGDLEIERLEVRANLDGLGSAHERTVAALYDNAYWPVASGQYARPREVVRVGSGRVRLPAEIERARRAAAHGAAIRRWRVWRRTIQAE